MERWGRVSSFQNWLSDNTTLGERTILNYSRTIERFFDEYNDPSIENINKFISKINRNTRTTYIKYAFKYYLEFMGRFDDYKRVVGIREKPKKNNGVYLSNDELLNIVRNIEDETYRLVALLQYITGVRATDVLENTWRNITDFPDGSVKIMIGIKSKGRRKEHTVFIPSKYVKGLRYFVETCGRKYPFLRAYSDTFRKRVDNNYRYYYEAVKKSAKSLGYPKFSTHDFRRNFLEAVFTKTKNIRIAKDLAGHSNIQYTIKYLKVHEDEGKLRDAVDELRG